MSYILEALRRADAERERERQAVPDLHARPLAAPAVDTGDESSRGWRLPWAAVAAGVAVLLLAALAWWWFASGDQAPGPQAAAPRQVTQPVTQASAPVAQAPQPAPTPPTPLPQPMPQPAAAAAKATPAPGPASAVAAMPASPALAPAPKSAPAPAPKKPEPAPERVPRLAELPPDVRAKVPELAVNGAVYSPAPAQRMVIVNGQVLREGDAYGANLRLQRINPKSAVFTVGDRKFELPF
jgi:general secretion pathway protein B